MITSFC